MGNPLNPKQLEAVQSTEGCHIISAGPGTGKTATFAHRIANLLQHHHIPNKNVLAVTFTRNAAKEMRDRLEKLLSGGEGTGEAPHTQSEIWIDTFHAIALKILKQENEPFGAGTDWTIADDQAKRAVINKLVPAKEIPAFLEKISKQKQQLLFPVDPAEKEYQKRLFDAKYLDFDDLFLYACALFEKNAAVKAKYRQQFRYILADEFQDTSFAQYQLMKHLVSENICVLGDPDQAIYGFHNSDFMPFEQFKQDYPQYRIFCLSENYRSQSMILEAAKQVIHKNPAQLPRELLAKMAQGLPMEITGYQTEVQEAEMIVRKIESLLGGSSSFTIDSEWVNREQESGVYGFQDIAILYRFHAQARVVERVLQRSGLPYRTFGKKSDAEEKEGRENVQTSQEVLQGEGITLMTLHRSKGLEFPVVFILGCEDGIIPFQDSETEEERRLFYVGITRAKNRLFFSHAKKRFLFGKSYEGGSSPFLQDIEEELRILKEGSGSPKRKVPQGEQLTLFG